MTVVSPWDVAVLTALVIVALCLLIQGREMGWTPRVPRPALGDHSSRISRGRRWRPVAAAMLTALRQNVRIRWQEHRERRRRRAEELVVGIERIRREHAATNSEAPCRQSAERG